ncbi:hypothetical protein YYC_05204 [Plasmodium yoelii 17X]|uniref:Uncharacterized protein n=4 Tax=Plasmodium yoelii TaxID=5861 RepID=A0AAE9WQQ8_PLAYO|nr:conserved protein, unknown function [Plasmodium yoelii]EAA16517.1 hypothetical protein [Plasmodium yoelii yoelii]ETB56835.1 hypothetical protein YYC_05204 [Plasmodium yoelii 17X]WBY58518.1 hypothetical protein Py17XNL_001105543 [Plasmodium yoelii yoelii]CDU18830.1 conserved Plasmodium protein, unknown function [Plasmodium yoelii]VTZ79415.1 conserved protein, unknown function [Plasmodium yoelii]|eukprot:XP_724952.1 conserved protein, unknown function [Plasmodium yoelii]
MVLKFIIFILTFLNKYIQSENDISVNGVLNVSNLKISSKDNRDNGIIFKNQETEYKLGLTPQNEFIISKKNKPMITIDEHDNINFLNPDLSVKALNIDGILKIKNVPQFNMIIHENFSNNSNTKGWIGEHFDNFTSKCGGINLLGGYGKLSKGSISKTFENIPSHIQIQIKSNFHFIDNWNNQTAYLKIGTDKNNLFYVWTDTHSNLNKNNSINICGNPTPETKYFSIIDIIIPHNSSTLFVEFGTNIQEDNPNDISWGISNFQLFII